MRVSSFRSARIVLARFALAILCAALAATAARAQGAPLVFDSISAGSDHACGLTAQHVAWCWGNNADGQLGNPAVTAPCGDGGDACSAKPVRVATSVPFAAISAGHAFTCALSTSGVPYCWGSNAYGQLGTGSQAPSPRPAKVGIEGVTFQSISAGDSHACAVTTAGAAYCWGSNAGGKLGTGAAGGGHTVPVAVGGRLVFRSISAGYFHTCALTRDGRVYCWGRNELGEVGGATRGPSALPVRVAGAEGFRLVHTAAQFDYTCGVDGGGAAVCWGGDCFAQLGVDSALEQCGTPPMPCSTKPVAVRAAGPFRTVAGEFSHSCALGADGALVCWGDNNAGQLGNGNSGDRSTSPVAVTGAPALRAVSVGREFTCGLDAHGAALCWGINTRGQLASGDTRPRLVPAPIVQP